MTIDEAAQFFAAIPKISRALETLRDVGLGYLTLGQQSTTLSGGEAQRVKLATELQRPARDGKTIYLLDERRPGSMPTTSGACWPACSASSMLATPSSSSSTTSM